MKLKVKRMLLLIAMLCAMSGASANDYDFEVDGIYYKMISLNDQTCRVVKKDNNFKYAGDVVIPTQVKYGNRKITVVELDYDLFYNCGKLTGITIPNTISSIKIYMFKNCNKLERVKFEDGETTLDIEANSNNSKFFGESPIKTIYIGRNLSNSPFVDKTTIKEVEIGNCVTKMPSFRGCSGFTNITIPNSVTEIGSETFSYCINLKSITIPNSVTSIGSSAFAHCWGLSSIAIPNSVTEIGSYAFSYCKSLTSITIPNSVTEIGYSAFEKCSGLTSITIPNSVIEIGSGAFYNCSGLTSITIPNSVTEIGNSTFSYCISLTSITIPNSVSKIDDYAFRGCNSLTSISIPNSVSKIGVNVVMDCDALTSFYCFATTPPTINEKYGTTFTTNQIMALNVYVPKEALADYQKTDGWKDLWNLQGFDPTAVDGIEADEDNGPKAYYDLQGRKSDAPRRGLNIVNGKKILVK